MIKKLAVAQRQIAEEVLAVQLVSYQIEAKLIGFADLPPLKETIADLQNSREGFYGFYLKEKLAGVISVEIENGVLEICRLFVHQSYLRKGIGGQLLRFIETHLTGFKEMKVSTGTDNFPAIHFYEQSGFSKCGQIITEEGLALTLFRKRR